MNRTATCLLAVLSLTTTASAATIPPTGFDSWISHGALYCHDPVTNGAPVCEGAEGSLPVENRVHPTWASFNIFTTGGGTASANQLTGFLSFNDGFNGLHASVRDTYTVSGAAGPVEIMVSLSGEAHAKRLPLSSGAAGGQPAGTIALTVQVAEGISSNGITLVNQLASAGDVLPFGIGPLETDLSAEVSFPLTVTANVPFPLAHKLTLSGDSGAEGNALNTAVIDFTVPEGYTISSDLGWTPVPEPSSLLLLSIGLPAVVISWRRRSACRQTR